MAKLYKGSGASGANNVKPSGRSSGIAVPYQPVRGGAKVLGSKLAGKVPKGKKLKLSIKTSK